MIDIEATVRTYLLSVPGVTALTGTRIYAGRDVPPVGYQPSDGGAICFKVRGGSLNYPAVHADSSLQFKCYGASEVAAAGVYRALVDALQDARTNTILSSQLEILGQHLEEPETQWRFVLAFFQIILVR